MRAVDRANDHRCEDDEIMPGVRWGRPEWVPSPAFWAALAAAMPNIDAFVSPPNTPLAEVVVFCLLGGYGVTAEMNHAAFDALAQKGLLSGPAIPSASLIEAVLRQPLRMGGGRERRYRFPHQKAVRIEAALRSLANMTLHGAWDGDARGLRDRLMEVPGVGPKTASWIVRNWLGSDEVAIIDIHIVRACRRMGVFADPVILPRGYEGLERRFLEFSNAVGVRASVLDALIWSQMRQLGTPAARP